MRHAAWRYEETHQELPPAFGPNGERRLNWLAFMLQEYSEEVVFSRLDFAKPWNAPVNQDAVNRSSLFREHVRGDGYVICPLRGTKSIWNLNGEPRGRTTDLPNAILFVAVPNASNMKPLQPHEGDEQAILSFLNRGYAVLYVECDGGCGRVSREGNELTFFEPYY